MSIQPRRLQKLFQAVGLIEFLQPFGDPIIGGNTVDRQAALGRLPKVGDRVVYPGGELEVVAMDGRRVAALRVHRRAEAPEQVV